MRNGRTRLAILLVLLGATAGAARAAPGDELKVAAERVEAACVVVEYHLRFDRGEAPRMLSWSNSMEALVLDERPLERAGLLVRGDVVATTDLMIHPRFVARIAVRRGGRTLPASPFAWLARGDGLLLRVEGDIGGTPLAFDAAAEPVCHARMYHRHERWGATAWRPGPVLAVEPGGAFLTADTPLDLRVAASGAVVGIQFFDELPLDGSWKGSPLDLPTIPAEKMAAILAETATRAARGLPRVHLSLRSQRTKGGGGGRMRFFRGGDESEDATEIHAVGVVLGERSVLVLSDLGPKVTARLEGILVHPPEGAPVAASFRASLKRLGAFLVETQAPLPGPLPLPAREIGEWRGRALVAAEVAIHGEERTCHLQPGRFDDVQAGFRGRLDPTLAGDEANMFLFDREGTLLALPVARREVESSRGGWRQSNSASLLACAHLKEHLDETDPANVPLSEEEEHRLAWIGVVLQPMDAELARAHRVSELAKGGDVGGLVSFVYAGSPAERRGIVAGDILLRVHAEGAPKPLDIEADESPFASVGLDLPEELEGMFDEEMPTPWPSAENSLSRMLTDLGAGRKYEIEFVRDGKVARLPFAVEFGPTHFDSARRHASQDLGLTVRDLTYEVRQHFQLAAAEPGVVVSKVEKGKKAAVAGVRLYEVITQIDETPLESADEFAKAIAGAGERRLTLKHRSRTRVVKVVVGAG